MSSSKRTSVAILVGKCHNSGNTVPVVVWANQERTRDSQNDKWKNTLEYYEFLDDTARWTHLDQLLVRFGSVSSLHVGSTESLKKKNPNAKSKRLERLVESLQVFLEERQNSDNTGQDEGEDVACHLHLQVPVDAANIKSTVFQLLLEDPDVQLAFRGNLQVSQGLLQQGLALWLQAEGILSSNNDHWINSMKMEKGLLNSHLVMDRTAAQCIHLLPPPNAGVATVVGGNLHNNSLWGLLSKPCLTQMGKQKLQVWLRQPLIDLDHIMKRQDAVTDLLGLGKDSIREALKTFSGLDLTQLANILGHYNNSDEGGTDSFEVTATKKPLQALYQLYLLASSKMPQLLEAASIETSSSLLQETQVGLSKLVGELERCQGLVEAVLDLDMAPREYLIKCNFPPELKDLYEEIESIQQSVDDEHAAMGKAWLDYGGKAGDVRLEKVDDSSWQFRLPNTNDLKALSALGSKVQTHRVLKNGVYFSTSALRQLSSRYRELMADYSQQSRKIVQDAMNVATTYQTVVERAADIVSTLDVLCALAHVAAYSPHGYCKPSLTDSEEDGVGIKLEAARHPCVELQEDIEYIPNDISLVFGESNFLLVTGPNMGGKSTYIRALGAIVCMAQIGSYVPCSAATINICHAILARVGAGDLQERGISTFMAEMLESSSILRTANKRSLIIIDELGRGTSTFDGYGLARAISEYLMKRLGCMVVFATHFHELTALPNVHNCHVTAQKGNQGLTFLYEIRPGPCLESFGIQVAEMANVPACVIKDAKRKAEQLENFGTAKRSKTALDDNLNFLERFRQVDIPSVLKEPGSMEEKRSKLVELLA